MSAKHLNTVYALHKEFKKLGLTSGMMLVLTRLAYLADENGIFYAPIGHIGEECLLELRQAQRVFSSLQEKGVIRKTGRYNKHNIAYYALILPAKATSSTTYVVEDIRPTSHSDDIVHTSSMTYVAQDVRLTGRANYVLEDAATTSSTTYNKGIKQELNRNPTSCAHAREEGEEIFEKDSQEPESEEKNIPQAWREWAIEKTASLLPQGFTQQEADLEADKCIQHWGVHPRDPCKSWSDLWKEWVLREVGWRMKHAKNNVENHGNKNLSGYSAHGTASAREARANAINSLKISGNAALAQIERQCRAELLGGSATGADLGGYLDENSEDLSP